MMRSRQQLEREVAALGLSLREIEPPAEPASVAIDAAGLQAPLGMTLAISEQVVGPGGALVYLRSIDGERRAVGLVRGDTIARLWDVPESDRGVFDLAWIDAAHIAATTRKRAVVIRVDGGDGVEVGAGRGGGHQVAARGSLIVQSTGAPGGDSRPRLWRWDGARLRRIGVLETPGACARGAAIELGVYTDRDLEVTCFELVDSSSPEVAGS